MRIVDVCESRHWRHKETGATCSVFGVLPSAREHWELVINGWTWVMADGTVGIPMRKAVPTREDALAYMRESNARFYPNHKGV